MINQKYGVVYTPQTLSDFVATLLKRVIGNQFIKAVLDPASGECSLLNAAKRAFGDACEYIGIDVDQDAVNSTKDIFTIIHNDAILPYNVKRPTADYWKGKLPAINAIIANPPWSSEKIYERTMLEKAGYTLVAGQYDSYVLFIELAYNILCDNGVMAFIIPDSLFDAQNERLRKFLLENTQIKIIARLGEKIFDEVNRATTVIICKKASPSPDNETICFRLSTNARKDYLAGKGSLTSFFDKSNHSVMQARFMRNTGYNFDIDAHSEEEELLAKITTETIDWDHIFSFGRGVEISKSGKIVYCPTCNYAQGYKKKQMDAGEKVCTHCGAINALIPVVDVKFDDCGVKYGWAGNQAVLFVDPKVISAKEDYLAFMKKLAELPVPEMIKKPKNAKVEENGVAEVEEHTEVVEDTEKRKTPAFLIKAKEGILKGANAVGKAGTVVADKTGDLLRDKNTVKRQMLFYGVVNLYRNGLEEFMNV